MRFNGKNVHDILQMSIQEAKDKNYTIRAVIPVHLAGRPVDLEEIGKIARKHNIKIIADSCHAIGGHYHDSPIGSCHVEDLATFSFHPVKTIATGEGGAITTNDSAMAQRMKEMRHHNMTKKQDMALWEYEMNAPGYNYRMTDIQCALGISQLQKLERFVEKRAALVSLYNEKLCNISPYIDVPSKEFDNQKIGWHLYAPRFDFENLGMSRNSLMEELKKKDIGTQVHYIPVHTQPYYKELYGESSLPGADEYYKGTLSLPLYPSMTQEDVMYVVDSLKEIVAES